MAQDNQSGSEPEPVEADFEPACHAASTAATDPSDGLTRPPPRLRSRSATLPELAIGCTVAALLGAVLAIGFNGTGSGVATGTLAREIDALTRGQAELAGRAEQSGADMVALRSRLDSQADRLAQRESGERAVRAEIDVLTSQLAAVAGTGDGQTTGASASGSALGVLLARIDRIEKTLADDAAAPKTTRQVQRVLDELAVQIAALNEADERLAAALNSREAALAQLEAGLARAAADIDLMKVRVGDSATRRIELTATRPSAARAGAPASSVTAPAPVLSAAPVHKSGRALAAVQNAAQSGRPFVSQLQALAALLPADADVAALRGIANRGAPPADQLGRGFTTMSRAVAALTAPETGAGWLRVASAVITASPDDIALMEQAATALELGDMRGASEAVGGMTGPLAAAFAPWGEEAVRRADLDLRLDRLVTRVASASAS